MMSYSEIKGAKMVKLTKWDEETCFYGYRYIDLKGVDCNRVVKIVKQKDNSISFEEMCDENYSINMSKEDAKIALQEAIDWIDQS